jgi:phenylacetate-CoA ligase
MYGFTLENFLLPLGDKLFNQGLIKRLKFLRNAQWWKRTLIDEYQNYQLSDLMEIAFDQVPFYKNLYSSQGLSNHDIKSVIDLQKFPIVTKKMLQKAGFLNTVRDTGLKTYNASTSGSTGENFSVKEDSATAGFYRASFMLSMEWAGYKIGQGHLQTGMTLDRTRDRIIKDTLLRCEYTSAYDLSDKHLDEILSKIERKKIKHLWGYPGSIFYLAKRAEYLGIELPLTSVATWGDVLYSIYREMIEKVFKTKVYDTYGCAEGIQIAAQCGHGSHYHVHEFDTIVELLDDNGNPVRKGESGNVILTRLYPGPMPLIRYAVGDKATWSEKNSCECGRKLRLLERIDGRSADEIITPSGNRLILHFFTGILEFFKEIESFQVIQESMSSITLNIVSNSEASLPVSRIISALKDKGADMEININEVENIPIEHTGKRKFIINKLLPQK